MTEERQIIDQAKLASAEPLTDIVCMKHWDNTKRRWMGVVCQAFKYADGTEGIVVYDVEASPTEAALDDWSERTMREKPWADDVHGEIASQKQEGQ